MDNIKTKHFYYPELDGLRFVAFLLVFIHNAPYLETISIWRTLHEYGWIGVDMFFCLSAFLITKLLILEQGVSGNINVKNYYFRRVLRIWPLYLTYIAIALFFSSGKHGWEHITLNLIGLLTATYNLMFVYLAPRIITLFLHLWTISYEEQFYVFIPWVLRISNKRNNNFRSYFLLAIFVCGSLVRAIFIFYQVKHPAIYMFPFTHFEAVLCGVAMGIGLFDQLFNKIQGWLLFLAGILFIIMVFSLPNTYEITWKLMLTYPLSGFGMALILYTLIYKEIHLISFVLKSKVLKYFGKISYGLYIFHILSIYLAGEIFIKILNVWSGEKAIYSVFLFIIGLSITLILAVISYYMIEKPFLKLKQQFAFINSHPR